MSDRKKAYIIAAVLIAASLIIITNSNQLQLKIDSIVEIETDKYTPCEQTYRQYAFKCAEKGRIYRIGKNFILYTVKGDKSHTFLIADVNADFDDGCSNKRTVTLKRFGAEVPESGTITSAFFLEEEHYDTNTLELINKICSYKYDESKAVSEEKYYSSNYYMPILVGYDDCPVASVDLGYIGKTADGWVFAPKDRERNVQRRGDISVYEVQYVDYFDIPEEYEKELDKLWLKYEPK